MIIVRRTSRTVFSSSWSRRKQAEMLNEWQNQTLNSKLRPVLLKGVTASNIIECWIAMKLFALQVWGKYGAKLGLR